MHEHILFAVLSPLVGFLLCGLLDRLNFIGEKQASREFLLGMLSTLSVVISFAFGIGFLLELLSLPENLRLFVVPVYEWFAAGDMQVAIAYQIDTLSVTMMLVVTGVGSLIHFYSIGYMHGDAGFARFFSYLNLFIFAMLNLVLAANMPLMFLGWEGVGLCSYLLIGFWYDRRFDGVGISTTTDAANKAFVMNRIGDFAMLAAMFLIFQRIHTLDFNAILAQLSAFDDTHLFWITLLIFIGCTGKSAQIPLYTWLPDAMAGPTPVSALIHAATMVTSGIYLISRLAPLYTLAPSTMTLIAVIGALTAIIAATIALAQNDIKKVLAYSTVSQLGYMFLALGVGAFSAAMFHLVTHAFFKACLFLGSGSVIHALEDEQDIRKMGGLRTAMPATSITFFVGSLALAGFPLTAGFFSKDEILMHTFASGQTLLYAAGILTAGLTAFYSMRLYTLTFLGSARYDSHQHPHESPFTMTLPLWILAALSVLGGLLNLPAVLVEHGVLHSWLLLPDVTHSISHAAEWILLGVSSVIAIGGLFFAYSIYSKSPLETESGWRLLLAKKYYIDELYDILVVKPFQGVLARSSDAIERLFLDNTFNGLGTVMLALGQALRRLQSGVAQSYAIAITFGLMVILTFILFNIS